MFVVFFWVKGKDCSKIILIAKLIKALHLWQSFIFKICHSISTLFTCSVLKWIRQKYSFMLKRNLLRNFLADMQLETQKKCDQLQNSSMWRACALWTFYDFLFYVLPDLHARHCSMLKKKVWFFCFCNKGESANCVILICVICEFWQDSLFFYSLCLIYPCLPALAAVSGNAPYYCVQFLHVKSVLLDFHLTNATFLISWTCASVKQYVETFQKTLVCNLSLWSLTVSWCAITLSIILILEKKSHTQNRYCVVSVSVFLIF